MARPMFLFLATENDLTVYDLAKPPIKTAAEWRTHSPELDTAGTIQAVASKLQKYRRDQIESGKLFEDERFGSPGQRADQSLIENLKLVRAELRTQGLKGASLKYAHALIGRSIFIRYLEDRGILTKEYFRKVARGNTEWERLLHTQSTLIDVDSRMDDVLYFRVLKDKAFTYAFFAELARDFNGDMFPTDKREEVRVEQKHLDLLRRFLQGDAGHQRNLFFWAYRFDIIPIELISSIYEEFYHAENYDRDEKGTHYTPASLVEFIVNQTLTPELLRTDPRVIDAAAGSGIFLIESFRRIVRYRVQARNGRGPTFRELQEILRNQIAGIEINEEAVRVAAFSLYLALLHYQKPPDILRHIAKGNRLPKLIYQEGFPDDDRHLNCLISGNAFDIESKVTDAKVRRRFTSNCADVALGNPPWGSAKSNDVGGVNAMTVALEWCGEHNAPVSDKERSQAFIWRTLDLLRNGGAAGLLVSTGVLYKKLAGSQDFRREWLAAVKLERVVNFAHVRDVFFRGPAHAVEAISPFASIEFKKEYVCGSDHLVHYWSAKKTAQVEYLQAVILSQPDLHLIPQEDLRRNSDLWKIYWWGNHRDAALIGSLEVNSPLKEFCNHKSTGQGFSQARKELKPTPSWLLEYDYLPAARFHRYGPLDNDNFEPVPPKLKRFGKREAYDGTRLLIKHGISQREEKGQIIARVETRPFCFSNSINGIKLLEPAEDWKYKVLLGIVWSSLARYYFFLTASKWGMWHFAIHKNEYLSLPILQPESDLLRTRICDIVEQLRAWNPVVRNILRPDGESPEAITDRRASLEYELDEVIFDLYRLTESERDLVRDMCNIGIEFFYKSFASDAVQPVTQSGDISHSGIFGQLPSNRSEQSPLEAYLHTFLKIWNSQLMPEGQFRWRVVQPRGDFPLLTIIFPTEGKDGPTLELSGPEQDEWLSVLQMLETELLFPYDGKFIYIDGMVRAVTNTCIVVIKRNERRLWTRSMAREDAEATLIQAMNLQEAGRIFSAHSPSPDDRTPLVG